MCSIVYFLPVPTLQQADNKNVLLLLLHCRYQWFWLATSVIWKMNELLDEIKVKTYQDSGEIGKHQTVPATYYTHEECFMAFADVHYSRSCIKEMFKYNHKYTYTFDKFLLC